MAAKITRVQLIGRVDRKLKTIIGEDLPLLKKVKRFVVKSGGKRIRPLTHYYFSQMLGYKGRQWEDVGAIGELIHAASLLHDDVIDEADVRRGKPSVNALYGNKNAVLCGDYLLACGLDHLRGLDHAGELIGIFTRVLKQLSIGELLQMEWESNWKIDQKIYQRIIQGKTASLFGAMTEGALVVSGNLDAEQRLMYRDFGERMGRLFQIRDDYLDYFSSKDKEGKEPYQDFRRGLITWPLLLLRKSLKSSEQKKLQSLWSDADKRQSTQGVQSLADLLEKSQIQNKAGRLIENDIHALMAFVREHPESASRDLVLEQLRALLVPVMGH